MGSRHVRILALVGVLATQQALGQEGFTVSLCYKEIPTSSCSPIELDYQHPVLVGPVPEETSRSAERKPGSYYYFEFPNVLPGNYIVRENGCNPFGCWLDTPVAVIDQDVQVVVNQIGPTPLRSPSATPTTARPCLGDGNDDRHVTIDELVGAVANSLDGCPP